MGQSILWSFFDFFSNRPKSYMEYGLAGFLAGRIPGNVRLGEMKSSRNPNFHVDSGEYSVTQSGSTMGMVVGQAMCCRAQGFLVSDCAFKTSGNMPSGQDGRDGFPTLHKSWCA